MITTAVLVYSFSVKSLKYKRGLEKGFGRRAFIIAAAYLGTTFLAWSIVQAAVYTIVRLLRLL